MSEGRICKTDDLTTSRNMLLMVRPLVPASGQTHSCPAMAVLVPWPIKALVAVVIAVCCLLLIHRSILYGYGPELSEFLLS